MSFWNSRILHELKDEMFGRLFRVIYGGLMSDLKKTSLHVAASTRALCGPHVCLFFCFPWHCMLWVQISSLLWLLMPFLEQLSAIVLTTDDISTTERLQATRPTLCIMLVPFWEVKQIPTGGCGTCGFRSLSFLRRWSFLITLSDILHRSTFNGIFLTHIWWIVFNRILTWGGRIYFFFSLIDRLPW